MKTTVSTLTLLLGFTAFSLTSCQKEKDWTCVCEISGDRFEKPIRDQKKSDAKDACDALEKGGASCSLD